MATLLFAAAGSALGGALGGSFLGVSAASIGGAIGGAIGRSVDTALLTPTQRVTGPRLDGLEVQKSQVGAGLPVVEGRGRVAGQVIWATNLEEVTRTTRSGGKGGGPKVESTSYSYFANFAVALTDCSTGPIRHFGRIWADGKLLDTADLN
ncbi:MAG: host specificity protein, partial [Pseudomonadota bacterium]